jgi:glycerol uptake facilitator-like aquaporin
MFRKNKLAMLVGEFLGTGALTLSVLAVTHSQLSLPYFTATIAGLMLAILVMALAGISGAVFNPALTIGLWTVRKMQTLQAIAYIIVQFAGAAAVWYLFVYLTKIDAAKIEFKGDYEPRILVAEMLGTFIFAFSVASAIYQRMSLGMKAFAIGGGLVAGSMVASLGSAGVLNPAVAWSLHQWGLSTYVLGPVLGAVIGFNLYNLLFVETEVAEVEEGRSGSMSAKLDSGLSQSLVAQEYEAKKDLNEDKVIVSGQRTAVRTQAGAKKAVAKKKVPAKARTTKK